jgi:hypothetical protein
VFVPDTSPDLTIGRDVSNLEVGIFLSSREQDDLVTHGLASGALPSARGYHPAISETRVILHGRSTSGAGKS